MYPSTRDISIYRYGVEVASGTFVGNISHFQFWLMSYDISNNFYYWLALTFHIFKYGPKDVRFSTVIYCALMVMSGLWYLLLIWGSYSKSGGSLCHIFWLFQVPSMSLSRSNSREQLGNGSDCDNWRERNGIDSFDSSHNDYSSSIGSPKRKQNKSGKCLNLQAQFNINLFVDLRLNCFAD